jgi:hypothetical protein
MISSHLPRQMTFPVLSRRAALLISLSIGLAAGLAYPYVDIAIACRMPESEACVWGKAYFPLTLGLSLVLLGGAGSGLLYACLMWRGKHRDA